MIRVSIKVWIGLLFALFFTFIPIRYFGLPVIGISDYVQSYIPITPSPVGSSDAAIENNLKTLAVWENIVDTIVSLVVWFVIGFLIMSIFRSKGWSSRFLLIAILVIFLVLSCLFTIMALGG